MISNKVYFKVNFTITMYFFLLDCVKANAHVNNIINFAPGDNIPYWTVDCPNNNKSYEERCSTVTWYCFKGGEGEISTVLHGRGRAKLDYGQCNGNHNGYIVKVLLNGVEISSAKGHVPSKIVSFDFNEGDILKITEFPDAVLGFNKFEVIECY